MKTEEYAPNEGPRQNLKNELIKVRLCNIPIKKSKQLIIIKMSSQSGESEHSEKFSRELENIKTKQRLTIE